MIEISELELRYPGAATAAVQGVSLSVPRQTLTALVGPNGSGKSTLVRALLGLLEPESGSVRVSDRPLQALSRKEVARLIAVIPQREEPVFPLPVRDYVAMGRLPHQSGWRGESADDANHVEAALHRAGVAALAGRRTDELSGGEWQRVRIARALAQRSEALVLDEPSTFLDVAHEMEVFELARELADEGHAVLLVSHQINLVARFADTMVLLHRGRVVAHGRVEEVMRADLLEEVYEWPLIVSRDPAVAAPALVPLRRR